MATNLNPVPTHWLLRIGDGSHFLSALQVRIWGVNSEHTNAIPFFLRNVKSGDLLWFILSNSKGKAIFVATFVSHTPRQIGPLGAFSRTNEELGWTTRVGEWDTEIHYKDAYDISDIDVLTHIQSPLVVRKFSPEKCTVNLPQEYANIVRYSNVKKG